MTELAAGKSGQTADALVPLGMPGYVPSVTHFAVAGGRREVTLTRPTGATETAFTNAAARVLRNDGAQVRIVLMATGRSRS